MKHEPIQPATQLRSVTKFDAGPRQEKTAVERCCWNCLVRWWSRDTPKACPRCGGAWDSRRRWRSEPFVAERLTAAREYKMLEVEELAARFGGSLDIQGIESGSVVPSRGDIIQLGRVLGFPPGFFTKKMPEIEVGTLFICESQVYCDDDDCWEDATSLCDYKTGPGKTCDRHMCDDHRDVRGQDKDYCPEHAAKRKRVRA